MLIHCGSPLLAADFSPARCQRAGRRGFSGTQYSVSWTINATGRARRTKPAPAATAGAARTVARATVIPGDAEVAGQAVSELADLGKAPDPHPAPGDRPQVPALAGPEPCAPPPRPPTPTPPPAPARCGVGAGMGGRPTPPKKPGGPLLLCARTGLVMCLRPRRSRSRHTARARRPGRVTRSTPGVTLPNSLAGIRSHCGVTTGKLGAVLDSSGSARAASGCRQGRSYSGHVASGGRHPWGRTMLARGVQGMEQCRKDQDNAWIGRSAVPTRS
jgi:hypothetical protein